MEYKVVIEGQTIPVPEEIGADDSKVKQALAPFFPDAANALITRVEKDGVTTVNVIKQAGRKGCKGSPLEYLIECQGGINPALVMHQRLQALPADTEIETLLALNGEIEKAIDEGQVQLAMVMQAANRLEKARAIPAPVVLVGF